MGRRKDVLKKICCLIEIKVAYSLLKVYNQFEVSIPSSVPRSGPAWIFFNHGGGLDIPAMMGSGLRPDMAVITSKGVRDNIVLNILNRPWDPIYIDQNTYNSHVSEHITRIFSRGGAVCIAPEGTRSLTGRMLSFKSGGIKRALVSYQEHNVPIIPCGIDAYELMPRGALYPKPGKVRIAYGPPIDLSQWKNVEITDSVLEEVGMSIRQAIEELLPEKRRASRTTPILVPRNTSYGNG